MKKENLNKACPFGFLSTKHFSSVANAPDEKPAKEANALIRKIVNDFTARISLIGKSNSAASSFNFNTSGFNEIAAESSSMHA